MLYQAELRPPSTDGEVASPTIRRQSARHRGGCPIDQNVKTSGKCRTFIWALQAAGKGITNAAPRCAGELRTRFSRSRMPRFSQPPSDPPAARQRATKPSSTTVPKLKEGGSMPSELPKQYEPAEIEKRIFDRWLTDKAFAALPDDNPNPYVIMMPLPNVTGALHMGHAMDNVMQDLLIRWHRMRGDNALWMPGTDHAGIATQAVVEKRLRELEGKTRHDIGRDALVDAHLGVEAISTRSASCASSRPWAASCDWDRQRFTMDDGVRARRALDVLRDVPRRPDLPRQPARQLGLPAADRRRRRRDRTRDRAGLFLLPALPGHRPAAGRADPRGGGHHTPGDHARRHRGGLSPRPGGRSRGDASPRRSAAWRRRRPREKTALAEAELEPASRSGSASAPADAAGPGPHGAGRAGKSRLPLLDRPIPLICDEWAKPELGSGCVKITPAHDPNDYDVWTRHQHEIDRINILNEDGTLNASTPGRTRGWTASRRVSAWWRICRRAACWKPGRTREIEIGHSDRSKTPIEPYLSRQWFVQNGRRRRRHRLRPRHRRRPSRRRAWRRQRWTRRGPTGSSPTGRNVSLPSRPGALRQHVPAVARRETRLVHQPAALVGAPHPGVGRRRSRAAPCRMS